ncbi:unnamed protein product [Arabis nemorensis]|uniref:Protein kinase domain-containing protein n=1 Tax=Arabis nemorensis TaxID=586526 RepID=A0A565B5F9_9BRAS|nr:unnamed protein product [Arabis nemorensis]
MVLGCFPLKSRKKRGSASMKRMDPEESKPTALPEPPKIPSRNLQSAPPSFRTRVKPIHPNNGGTGEKGSRARVMSAPSSIHGAAERDFLAGVYHDEQDEQPRDPRISTKESSPQPLPLPSPKTGSALKNWGSFKSFNGRLSASSASGPLPLPPSGTVRSFSYEEVVSACCTFASERCVSEGLSSIMYMASFGDEVSTAGLKKVEAIVVRLTATTQSIREFINEVSTLASLQHQNLCKLVGYHARDGSETRMLVYERLAHGSLDRLLHGRSDGPPLDWNTRMKIALCAAQGLTFLHEEGPFQAMYNEFSTANIQVDKDFSAKISGYGCAGLVPETEASNSPALANLSVETLERGLLTPKSNVWSYGIVLLEILTGRKNMDGSYPKEERNLVKWSRAFLADDCRLSLIMDPQLKGRFPAKAARSIADIAQKCLQVEPSERPTMRNIVDQLKIIQDMKYSCRFPLREPAPVAARKHMGRSSSLNTIIWTPGAAPPRTSFSPSPPPRRPSVSPTRGRALVFPPVFPPRACSSLEVMSREEVRRRSSSTSGIYCSLSANDIKAGTNIEVDGAPWRVLEFLHVKPGKGAAFVRTKIRNYVNGSTVERTFRAGISVEEANVYKETKQFTYKEGSQFVFMDLSTYEETRLNESDMGDKTRWLKEGMECNLLYWKDKVIDFELPNTVQLTVVDVDPGLRGDTAQGGSKPATVETGAVVTVPLFVNVGEEILVDTRTGMYMNRA